MAKASRVAENQGGNEAEGAGLDAGTITAETSTVPERAPKRARSNEYLLEEWSADDLPKRKGGNSGPRDSVLDKQVKAVIEKFPQGTGDKLVMIAKYGNGGQGGISAATTLRKRWAERDKGLVFMSRQLDDESRGVFVQYTPGMAVDEAKDGLE